MLAKDSLVVTTSWDDGTITDLKLAELLEKYGIKRTFYIATSFLDNPLTKKDIVALDKKFEIDAHTINHPDLTNVSLLEAKREIKDSFTNSAPLGIGKSLCYDGNLWGEKYSPG